MASSDSSRTESLLAPIPLCIKAHSWSHGLICHDEVLLDTEELDLRDYALPSEILEELQEMEPAERRAVLDELTGQPDLWLQESEAMLL